MSDRLHIQWSGRTDDAAPTLVLLHGITNSGAVWADAISRWSSHYRVAAIDALGHGLSDRFTDRELADSATGALEALVTTTIEALDQIAASAPVVLIGHSMGGATASAVAGRRPELLRGLVLEDPAWKAESRAAWAERGAGWLAVMREQTADPEAAIADALADPDLTWPRSDIPPWVHARAQLDERFIAIGRPEQPEPWQQLAAGITVPTLLVTGTDDVIVDEGMRGELAELGNPRIQVAVIDGAGHSTRRDRSTEFHAIVDPWIAARFAENDAALEEVPLLGGSTHAAISRVGDTVRRPTGPWTPSVHAVLRHLEKKGVSAPRVLGIDEHGREILTFIPGDMVWPDRAELLDSVDFLAQMARSIRSLHDALADFEPAVDAEWMQLGSDPAGRHELVCHNDLGPWNLVVGADGALTYIDWDTATPARRVWDLCWPLLGAIPLLPSERSDAEIIRRLEIFIDAYGRDDFPTDVLDVAIERCRLEADRIEAEGGRLLEEGHATTWRDGQKRVAEKAAIWRVALD